jgi:hypothetical protein
MSGESREPFQLLLLRNQRASARGTNFGHAGLDVTTAPRMNARGATKHLEVNGTNGVVLRGTISSNWHAFQITSVAGLLTGLIRRSRPADAPGEGTRPSRGAGGGRGAHASSHALQMFQTRGHGFPPYREENPRSASQGLVSEARRAGECGVLGRPTRAGRIRKPGFVPSLCPLPRRPLTRTAATRPWNQSSRRARPVLTARERSADQAWS